MLYSEVGMRGIALENEYMSYISTYFIYWLEME